MTQRQTEFNSYNGPSMKPTFKAGDGLIIETFSEPGNIKIGDVITYSHPSGKYDVVHRVVDIIDGKFKTQGDNNDQPDPYLLTFIDIVGKVIAVKRHNRKIDISGSSEGLRYFYALRKKKKIRTALTAVFRPLYYMLAKTGWFYGLFPFQVVKFKRADDFDYQLLYNGYCLGRKKPGADCWEIQFPYRLFVNEEKLPEINDKGLFTILLNHFKKLSLLEIAAFSLFYFNSVEIIFQVVQFKIINTRVNVFSGLLCLLCLVFAIAAKIKDLPQVINRKEFGILTLLVFLGLISIFFGGNEPSSIFRLFVLLSSCFSGFFCARILLRKHLNKLIFSYFCLLLLFFLIFLGLTGLILFGDINYIMEYKFNLIPKYSQELVQYYLSVHIHYWIDIMILLSIIPLGMVLKRKSLLGFFTLFLAYLILIFSRLRFAIIAPFIAWIIMLFSQVFPLKKILVVFLLLLVGAYAFIYFCPDKISKISMKHGSIAYRLENYPFSWHIATQHPMTGIGLRASRMDFFKDYKLKFEHTFPGYFKYQVNENVTSENIFLTLLAGLGFPFTIIFVTALAGMMVRLAGMCLRMEVFSAILHPVALFTCLSLVLCHSLLYDNFLFTQISWYFFIFVGLIPIKKKLARSADCFS